MATRTPQDPPKPKRNITFLKVMVTPIFVERDEQGEIIGDFSLEQPMQLHRRDFDQFSALMDDALAQVKAQLAAQQNGSGSV